MGEAAANRRPNTDKRIFTAFAVGFVDCAGVGFLWFVRGVGFDGDGAVRTIGTGYVTSSSDVGPAAAAFTPHDYTGFHATVTWWITGFTV